MIRKTTSMADSQMFLKSFLDLNHALRLEVALANWHYEGDASYFVDDLCNFLVNCPVSKMNISVRFHLFTMTSS